MADIELVIKISEAQKKMVDTIVELPPQVENDLISAIRHGTPLPKEHGKLIDVKDLLEEICLEDTKENRKLNLGEHITLEDIDRIKPVIEADDESKK